MMPTVFRHFGSVTREQRQSLNGHRSVIVWFTGLSGSGKSTLAYAVEEALHQRGCRTFVLDGDYVRLGLCGDLGYSATDRQENIRRVGEVAKLFMEAGVIVLTAFISPFHADRERARSLVGNGDFLEVYCDASLAICEARDTKGLYKQARLGKIGEFTGISSPYEVPGHPDIVASTGTRGLEACVRQVVDEMVARGICQPSNASGL